MKYSKCRFAISATFVNYKVHKYIVVYINCMLAYYFCTIRLLEMSEIINIHLDMKDFEKCK